MLPRFVSIRHTALDALPQGRQFGLALGLVDPIEPALAARERAGVQHPSALSAVQRGGLRPQPVFRTPHQVGTQRIPLHVTQDGPQMLVLFDGKRLVMRPTT